MIDAAINLSSGRKLCYAEFGDPKGAPDFYFHGWPCSRLHGWSMDAAAKRCGIRLVCPDRPGIGLSDYHPGRALLDWPQVVEELAAHLGWGQFHVVGVSGGGPYALACALRLPGRLLSCQVLCGAPPFEEYDPGDMFWVYRFLIRLRRFSPLLLGLTLIAGSDFATTPCMHYPVSLMLRMLPHVDRHTLSHPTQYHAIAGSFHQAMINGPEPVIADADIYLTPWRFSLSDITYPVDFWHGMADINISWKYTQKIAGRMPNAVTHFIDGEGHYSLPVNCADRIFGRLKNLSPAIGCLAPLPHSSPA